jgi:dienelactone hydrolase
MLLVPETEPPARLPAPLPARLRPVGDSAPEGRAYRPEGRALQLGLRPIGPSGPAGERENAPAHMTVLDRVLWWKASARSPCKRGLGPVTRLRRQWAATPRQTNHQSAGHRYRAGAGENRADRWWMAPIAALVLLFPALITSGGEAQVPAGKLLGEWHGYWVGDIEVRVTAAIEEVEGGLQARTIWWSRMPLETALLAGAEDGSERLPELELPPHAWLGTVDFSVVVAGTTITFDKTAGLNLYPTVVQAPRQAFTMSGTYKEPGIIVQSNPDASMLLLWRDGALRAPLPLELEKGKTYHLACLDNPAWHYRAYVPKSYDHATPAPVLMNCSPNRNALPLSTKLAEELGWIMIGLTERENRSGDVERHNRAAVIFDIRRRFNVDWNRFYASGFSGGARCAALTAVKYPDFCKGVICIGAGYAYDSRGHYEYPPYDTPIAFVIGEQDELCYREVLALYNQQKAMRPCTLIVHPGGHTWAGPGEHEAAIRWLEGVRRERTALPLPSLGGYVPPDRAEEKPPDTSDERDNVPAERVDTGARPRDGTWSRPRHQYPE